MAKREFTKEECKRIARLYSQKRLFIAKEMTCYQYAKAHGWADEITAHMKRYTRVKTIEKRNKSYMRLTDEELIELARPYETIGRLHDENSYLLTLLRKRGIQPSSFLIDKRHTSQKIGRDKKAASMKELFPHTKLIRVNDENLSFFDNKEKTIIINDLISYYMQLRTDFTNKLQQAAQQYTIQQLSDLTGLDKSNVHKMLNGKSNPSIDTILKVTNALNLEIVCQPTTQPQN